MADGISERLAPGTLTAIIGLNGAGKSTLLRVIAGLEKPLSGEVRVTKGEPTASDRAKIVSFVGTERPRVAGLRAGELAALGRTPHTGWSGRLSAQDRSVVAGSLATVGMGAMADAPIDTLSDGELQRVMIARALAQDTPVMVLDEPTAFLDFAARRQVVELLARLAHERGKTVIFSSHELDLVKEFSDKILEL